MSSRIFSGTTAGPSAAPMLWVLPEYLKNFINIQGGPPGTKKRLTTKKITNKGNLKI